MAPSEDEAIPAGEPSPQTAAEAPSGAAGTTAAAAQGDDDEPRQGSGASNDTASAGDSPLAGTAPEGAAATAPLPPEPSEEPVAELTLAEEAVEPGELAAEALRRKAELESIPDGPRPQVGGAPARKRRTMFVDWHLQLSYVGVYLATAALLTVGFLALNQVFISFFRRALAIQTQRPFAESTDTVMLITLNVVLVLLLVIGMAVYAIVQSHRVAGPAYRLRRALHQLARRDYAEWVQLRRKDYLKDLAEQTNQLASALKHKDVVLADAVLALEDLGRAHPELADRLEPVAARLLEVLRPPADDDQDGAA
ncbi:MAG: hypothetical protein D6731_16075 [Planctomycetota bacterium]|nr:MAG: hypothetical protein D6731_16075 [Planctomycetota bacterium]